MNSLRGSSQRQTCDLRSDAAVAARQPGGRVPTVCAATTGAGTNAAASDGHVADVTSVRLLRVTAETELATLHACPLSVAVIVQLYTAYCVSPSRSVQR